MSIFTMELAIFAPLFCPWGMPTVDYHPYPWVVTHGCVMPPVGSHPRLCYVTPTGFEWWFRIYPWVITHGCIMSPRRGSMLCHPYGVHMVVTLSVGFHPRLCYATATRFCVIISFTVGYTHDVRFTHGCIMSPRRGSMLLCHPYGVRMVVNTLSVG